MAIYTVEFRAMGSHMQAWLDAPTAANAGVLQHVPVWFEAWEAALSRFRPTSELCHLNDHAGLWVRVSKLMLGVVQAAVDAARMTNGLFNPLILPALEAAGYDRSFNPGAFAPHPHEYADRVPAWEAIEINVDQCCVRLPAGSRLDLGGVAKGWAAQRAAQWLYETGPCLVDAGGDMAARGAPDSSDGWEVTVPDDSVIVLRDAAVATSGTDYRQWVSGDRVYHHLIDPRIGSPADSNILTATVVADNAVRAEAWAKAALISGAMPELPTLFVHQDGSIIGNSAFMLLRKELGKEVLCAI